jgi:dihydrodipicolinate synthase/N-acetylneuraminate lyase
MLRMTRDVLPALITPFTPDGSAIDTDALGTLIERLIGAGVGGLSPAGAPASSRRCPARSAGS